MFRRASLLLFCAATACGLSSCRLYDSIFKDDAIARVGSDVLCESDIAGLLPSGCSPEDSAGIVRRYVVSWATDRLLLMQAEKELPTSEQDIRKEVEELRSDLLVYRYEMKYVDAHLDTLISESECESYYNQNRNSFITSSYLVTGVFVKVSTSSPNYRIIKGMYTKSDEVEELRKLCYSSADRFLNFEEWMQLDAIALDLGMPLDECVRWAERSDCFAIESDGYAYLVNLNGVVKPGEVAPYSYNVLRIKEMILSKRKQELIRNLEGNLLEDAQSSGKFIVYQEEK